MDVVIAYCIAGLSTFSLLALWFANAYKVLSQKREEVQKAQEQIRLHREGYQKRRGCPEEQTARHMLETSNQICEQIKAGYNETLRKNIYRFPGFLMGFRAMN